MDHSLSLWGTLGYCRPSSPKVLITLRNAQVRRISWVRRVRPVRERYEWPPHDAAPGRPPFGSRVRLQNTRKLRTDVARAKREACFHATRINAKGAPWRPAGSLVSALDRYLIFASRNSTCFLATGS